MAKEKAKPQTTEEEEVVEEDITLDMTTAKTFEPLPTDRPYLAAISAWKTGKSAKGDLKLHYELSVLQPEEFANRKVIVDNSLVEEYNLGRLQTNLIQGFEFPEAEVKSKTFKLPKSDDMLGQQCTLFVRTQEDPTGQYNPKSVIRKLAPASAYKAPGAI